MNAPVLYGFGRPSGGYFPLKTEILGADRVLDVHYDCAPTEKSVGYSGYVSVTKVLWNGVDITTALSKDDLKNIAEELS